jgi:hypothetical protein
MLFIASDLVSSKDEVHCVLARVMERFTGRDTRGEERRRKDG